MDLLTIIGIAFALAVDASVVAFSYGLVLRSRRLWQSVELALVTALFQGMMPVLGFCFTGSFRQYIEAFDHWLALLVFSILGTTIIVNALRNEREDSVADDVRERGKISFRGLLGIGVATSIDALAVGAGMACMSGSSEGGNAVSIGSAAGIIAGITFGCVISAFWATQIFKSLPERIINVFAGLILISLGVITLVQHICE